MANPSDAAQVVYRGQALYEQQIRAQVEPQHNGKILVLDVNTGDYEVDTDTLAALDRARAKIAALNLPYEAPTLATLANGSILQLQYYRVTVLWDGQRRSVPALATDGGPRVGMSMLYGYRLIIDAVDGGDVMIERRQP